MSSRLHGHCFSEVTDDGTDIRVDFDGLVRRLLLFDTYMVRSFRFKEVMHLVAAWGWDATVKLLESGAIRLICDTRLVISPDYRSMVERGRLRRDAVLTIDVGALESPAPDQLVEAYGAIRTLDLNSRQRRKLEVALQANAVVTPTGGARPDLEATKVDILGNRPYVKRAVALALQRERSIAAAVDDFELVFHPPENGRAYGLDTDIHSVFGLSLPDTHALVTQALVGLGAFNKRLFDMEEFDAVSSFADEELDMLEGRLGFLRNSLNPGRQEEAFLRVLEITGLPTVEDPAQVDLTKLIEVRGPDECRAFRDWLRSSGPLEQEEMADRVASLGTKLGGAVTSTKGQAVRFALTEAMGLAFGPAAMAAGALDTFLTERLFDVPAPVSFLSKRYPSIFRGW